MILKTEIENSVQEQRERVKSISQGVERKLLSKIKLSAAFVTIITGIRRCGKSTLMHQLMGKVDEEFAYFNFEDPRIFGFDVTDFPKLEEVLGEKNYYFFDEIQNIEHWELFIRKLHDQGKIVCITGSNASLLSKELGSRLTGRHIQHELFPFDFDEFCKLEFLANTNQNFDLYIQNGGFPSFLQNKQLSYLQQLFRDIITRDIIVRYGIRNAKTVESIALFLISNIAKEYSLNKLKNTFDVGSANSVSDYVSWFENSYLLFSLPRFSWSLKSVAVNPKKIYTIDPGFAQANSLSFSEDKGRLLENLVYLELLRSHKELYYFRKKGECDFVVKHQEKIVQLVQVCYELNSDNLQREINGLKEAMDFFDFQNAIIVTRNQDDLFSVEGKTIKAISFASWMKDRNEPKIDQ